MVAKSVRAFTLLLAMLLLLAFALPAFAQDGGGRICVAAYHDANRNGMRDPLEPLLADVVATLQNDQAIVIATYVTTGQAEPHCFEDLPPGFYLIGFSGGMAVATGEQDYGVTLSGMEVVPVQVSYGAVPEASRAAPTGAASSRLLAENDNLLPRVVFAAAGAVLIMVLVAAVGLFIFWLRFRRA